MPLIITTIHYEGGDGLGSISSCVFFINGLFAERYFRRKSCDHKEKPYRYDINKNPGHQDTEADAKGEAGTLQGKKSTRVKREARPVPVT